VTVRRTPGQDGLQVTVVEEVGDHAEREHRLL